MKINRRHLLGTLASAAATLPLAGCFGSEDVTKRIKIIAKAEVDGKPVEGSTVMEITWRPRGDGGMNADVLGEAVILELAGRGTVFVLPKVHSEDDESSSSGIWMHQVAKAVGIKGAVQRKDLQSIKNVSGRFSFFPVSGATLPLMVAFADEKQFRSIYRVRPEDFSKFGSGVRFIGIEFEPTDEPVTKLLTKRLPVLLEPDKSVPDSELRKPDGRLIPSRELPFKYRVGQNSFFAPGRY